MKNIVTWGLTILTLTSVPTTRDARRVVHTIGTLKSSDFDSLSALNFPVVWYQLCSVPIPKHPLPAYSEIYDRVIAFAPNCGEPSFMF